MFTQDILEMLFDELSALLDLDISFEDWEADNPDWENMTDQQIYAALPSAFYPYLGEFDLNASWMHDGM